MKRSVIFLMAIIYSLCLTAQGVDGTSAQIIESFVKGNVDIQMESVDHTTLTPVFSGKFYKVTVGFIETGTGASSCGTFNFINIFNGKATMIEPIHMDLECPVLFSLIRKDFMMKDENAAKLFESALNILYPVDKSDAGKVKHLKKDSQWIFVRGEFFDDFTVFIVKTDSVGKITGIDLVLAYTLN